MKNDKEIIHNYLEFKRLYLDLFYGMISEERIKLRQINLFNKKAKTAEIISAYQGYVKIVDSYFEDIYSSSTEYQSVIKNSKVLMNGQSLFATTDIQRLVEYFYFCLMTAITYKQIGYDGLMKQSDVDKVFNVSIQKMEEMKEKIDLRIGL